MERGHSEKIEGDIAVMVSSGVLISLSGIDGVGKSTLASWIQERLAKDYGLASRYVWCKFGDHPFRRYRLARSVERVGFVRSGLAQRETGGSPSRLYKVYGGVMLVFHLAQIALVVRASLKRGEIVVCDRYVFDTMVDLQQELHYSADRVQNILGAEWIPHPDAKFLLDLSEQVAFARKPDDASIEYLRERRILYLDIAGEYGLNVVDASQPIELVCQTVIRRISETDFQREVV